MNKDLPTALFIRADASSEIGTGHVMRCLALAQAWRERQRQHGCDGEVCFICCTLPGALEQRLRDDAFHVLKSAGEPGSDEDIHQTLIILAERAPPVAWLIADGYKFDVAFQNAIRRSGTKLMIIDDYNHLNAYRCDVLLNQNIGSEDMIYDVNDTAVQLLGLSYVLLRQEFVKAGLTCEYRDRGEQTLRPRRVLITMGGADLHGMTSKVLAALSAVDVGLDIKVVAGAASTTYGSILELAKKGPHPVEVLSNVQDMSSLMFWADLAVSAAGSTCWELLLFELPILVLIVAENQQDVARIMGERGVAVNLGWYSEWSDDAFVSVIQKVIKDGMALRSCRKPGSKLIDGHGCERVLEVMDSLQ